MQEARKQKKKLIDYVLVAEFDKDEGAVVRVQFPSPVPGADPVSLASYMLSEGCHKWPSDYTMFFLQRAATSHLLRAANELKTEEKREQEMMKVDLSKRAVEIEELFIGVTMYIHDSNEWKQFTESVKKQMLTVGHDKTTGWWKIQIFSENKKNLLTEIPVYTKLQYTRLRPDFATIYTPNGEIIGFEFERPVEQKLIEDALAFSQEEAQSNTELRMTEDEHSGEEWSVERFIDGLNCNDQTLYFLNYIKTKLSHDYKRGSVVWALAIGSHRLCIEPFKKILAIALNEFMAQFVEGRKRTVDDAHRLAQDLYACLNQIPLNDVTAPPYFQRKALKHCSFRKKNLLKHSVIWRGQPVGVLIPLTREPDEMLAVSLSQLVLLFKDKTMLIFKALVEQQRIIFSGENVRAEEVCNLLLASLLMVSPPLFGILQRVFPYAALTTLDFLSVRGYIAGVTNPLFKKKQDWYDVCCDVDSGEVLVSKAYMLKYQKERYYQLDQDFISVLLYRLQHNEITEEQLRQSFEGYTQAIVDMSLESEGTFRESSATKRLMNLMWERVTLLKKTDQFTIVRSIQSLKQIEQVKGVTLLVLESHINKLRFIPTMSKSVVGLLFQQIRDFLKEGPKGKALSLFSKYREGLSVIAIGLFSKDTHIRSLTVQILQLFEQHPVGRDFVGALNFFQLLQYHRLSNKT